MRKYGIPTAEYEIFQDYDSTKAYLDGMPESFQAEKVDELVQTPLGAMMHVKRSREGAILMSGTTTFTKNARQLSLKARVTAPLTRQEAYDIAKSIFAYKNNKQSTTRLMVEKKYEGPRIVVTAFCDGKDFGLLPAVEIPEDNSWVRRDYSQDNVTGCISNTPLSPELWGKIENTILQPVFDALFQNGKSSSLEMSA